MACTQSAGIVTKTTAEEDVITDDLRFWKERAPRAQCAAWAQWILLRIRRRLSARRRFIGMAGMNPLWRQRVSSGCTEAVPEHFNAGRTPRNSQHLPRFGFADA